MIEPFGVASYDIDGGRVITLRGELDASTCPAVAGELIAPPGSLVVVDLRELAFMDSSGIGTIHTARQQAIRDGGNLVVSRPHRRIYRVLEITGLDMWVTDWNPAWSAACDSARNE